MKIFNNYSRLVPLFMATALGVLMAGCGGGSGSDAAPILGSGGTVATVAPFATVVSPLPGATGVSVNTKKVTVAFSKAMDGATLNASSFTLACPGTAPVVGTTVAYAATGSVATLTIPSTSTLPASTLCTATVTTAAKDIAGVALVSNFSWNFTTGVNPDTIAPTITGTVNANGATNVALNSAVSATFSEALDPATITGLQFTMKESLSGTPVAGTVSYSGVIAEFKPSTNLQSNTRYTLTIKGGAGGVTDVAGNALANDYVWSWTTGLIADTTAPTVTATIHANGATGVPTNAKVGATFSEPIAVASLSGTNFTLAETLGGKLVAGVPSYSGTNFVFIPLSALSINTSYTARLKGGATGIKDLAGNTMANDYVWSWTTSATADTTAPTIVLLNPANLATNVAVTSSINATFDEAMDPLTTSTANFSVAGITGLVGYNAISKIMTFTPSTNLAPGTTYTATVTTGAQDLAGNALAANKLWTFTTAGAVVQPPSVSLGAAGAYGIFGGTAGMTNTGNSSVAGNIGTTATSTSSITGFHDTAPLPSDAYTDPGSIGTVNGTIFTCTTSTTGRTAAAVNAASCATATAGLAAASTAYGQLAGLPSSATVAGNLGGLTLAPGVYTSQSTLGVSGNLTLDAQGNSGAVWVFQVASALSASSGSITLAGGAQAGNVYWQVGSSATLANSSLAGTIIAQQGVTFTGATLQGRALSLVASVTLSSSNITAP